MLPLPTYVLSMMASPLNLESYIYIYITLLYIILYICTM